MGPKGSSSTVVRCHYLRTVFGLRLVTVDQIPSMNRQSIYVFLDGLCDLSALMK